MLVRALRPAKGWRDRHAGTATENSVKEVGIPPVPSSLCTSLTAVSTALRSRITKTMSKKQLLRNNWSNNWLSNSLWKPSSTSLLLISPELSWESSFTSPLLISPGPWARCRIASGTKTAVVGWSFWMTSNEDRYERSTRTHTIIYYRCNECGDTISKTQLSLRTLAHVHIPCLYNDRFTPMQVSQALPLNRHAPVEQPRMKRNARQKKKKKKYNHNR